MNLLSRIVAIDPGVTTGIAVHELWDEGINPKFSRLEMGPEDHHKELWDWLHTTLPDVIVYERFEYQIRQHRGTQMPGIRLESREYIGLLKLYKELHPVNTELVPQMMNIGKGIFPDTALKRLGLYRAPGGRQHMNDATRHLMYYIVTTLRRREYLDPLRPTQPPPEHQ